MIFTYHIHNIFNSLQRDKHIIHVLPGYEPGLNTSANRKYVRLKTNIRTNDAVYYRSFTLFVLFA